MRDDNRQMDVDLSVIIVNYNTRDLLETCLASIMRTFLPHVEGKEMLSDRAVVHQAGQTGHALSIEVIVVDNGSTDGSSGMVHASYPHVRLLEMGENTGFARGSNVGIRASDGRYILLLNSDTVVLDDALTAMVSFLDDHPEVAVIGSMLLNRDGSLQPSCFAFPAVRDTLFESLFLRQLFPNSPFFNRLGLGGFDRKSVRDVDWVSGACLMVRRSVVEQVGPLDESYYMYGEELDWCYRIKQAGFRIAFFPEARVIHLERGSSKHMRSRIGQRAMSGRLRYFRRYHGTGAVLAVRAVTVLGMVVRLVVAPLWYVLRPESAPASLAWYWGMFRAAVSARASQ